LQWESIVKARFPNQPLAQSDDFERHSRLVSLVYEKLRDMEVPTDEGDEHGYIPVSGVLIRQPALANPAATAPKVRKPKLPASMYPTPT
jgi:hypothetical protein